jgi:restriction system protein
MAIPDYQTLMLPALRCLADGRIRVVRDVVEELADKFGLTDADRAQLLPSGGTLTFASRVGWAKTYLKKAGLLTQPKRGIVQISPKGRELLAAPPDVLNTKFLDKFESFQTFRNAGRTPLGAVNDARPAAPLLDQTPEEVMDTANVQLRAALADEVLDRVKACPPAFFEQLVVQLLIRMGYGGSREEAGRAVGRSGDGGIDGIINEDRLGLEAIYLQAKRWEGIVGRPEIMKFVGALAGQRATKGVFITTSGFTQEAKDYAATSQYKVVLLNGTRLADLMIEHDLGVSVAATYQLKRIDSDFFADG